MTKCTYRAQKMPLNAGCHPGRAYDGSAASGPLHPTKRTHALITL
jgi:hypothetical protein